ncbi:MAG: AAA family ATPase [Pseudomonadota bacterium]
MHQQDIDDHWIWPLVEQGLTVFPLGTVNENPPAWVVERQGGDREKAKASWPKMPRGKWAQYQRAKPADSQIAQWIVQHPGCNFAIATGKEIDVVDADDDEAVAWVRENLTRTPWTVRTTQGVHFYYQTNEKLTLKNSADEHAKVDTRGYGGYVVAPGSVHNSGQQYVLEVDPAWPIDNIKDLPSLTPEDLEKISAYKRGPGFNGAGNLAGFDATRFAPATDSGVREGGRNQNLARLVGGWIQQGHSVDQVLARAMQTNAGNQPPLPDQEVITIVQSVTATHARNNAGKVVDLVVPEAPESSNLLLRPSELQAKPPSWLIKGVLPASGVGLLYGPSGSGKSFAVLDMALSIAAGIDWHGRKTKRPGGVIYVCGEGREGVASRLRAWEKHTSIALNKLPIRVTRVPVRFLDPASTAALSEAIEAEREVLGGVVAVVIDTLNRNFGDGDENTTKDMTRFVDAITDLQKNLESTVLVIHHTGHQDVDRARGSSALRASMDFEIQHKPAETFDEDSRFSLIGKKMKDGSEMPKTSFSLQVVTLGTDEDGEEYGSCVLELVPGDAVEGAQIASKMIRKLGTNEQKIFDLLTQHKKKILTNRPDLTEILIERKELVEALKNVGIAQNKTATVISRAESKNWVLPLNKFVFSITQVIE